MSASLVLVIAGDPSGDLHAANLIAALKRRDPELRVASIGGPLSRAAADEFLEDLASRGITGFSGPLREIGFFLSLARRIEQFFDERHPNALICVDYYGFNRRILSMAQHAGTPAFYYISPQVWASRPGRIKVLKRLVRKMLVIFPFEEYLYQRAGVPVEFVGHPLLDLIPEPAHSRAQTAGPVIGILPGSRSPELRRHLPVLLEAFARIRSTRPSCQGLLFSAPSQPDAAYGKLPPGITPVRDPDYACRATLDLALCSSGTATLECALLGIPMVVIYKASWLNYVIARALLTIPHIAMVNVLACELLVPELIQRQASAERVAAKAAELLDNPSLAASIREELLAMRRSLGKPGAAERAAAIIDTAIRTCQGQA